MDTFCPTQASTNALAGALSDCGGSDGPAPIALLLHEPSEQLFVLNRSLTGSRCRKLVGLQNSKDSTWYVNAHRRAGTGTVSQTPPDFLCNLANQLHNQLMNSSAASDAPVLKLGQPVEEQTVPAHEGISLAGFLLEYPCVYTLLDDEASAADSESPDDTGNNLSDVPLSLFTVSLNLTEQDKRPLPAILQFTIPTACIGEREETGPPKPSVARLEFCLLQTFQERIAALQLAKSDPKQQAMSDGHVTVTVSQMSLPLVGL